MLCCQRVPLTVEALFMPDGGLKPVKIYCDGVSYEVSAVTCVRKYCPREVSCVAPEEYCVIIGGREKKIYYEPFTNTWFSVKEKKIK